MGWTAGALFFGLYWGERNRRLDVQWRERVQRPPGWRPPLLHNRMSGPEPVEPEDELIRERMILDAMKEGLSRAEAEEDVDQIRSQAHHDAPVL